MVQMIDHTHSSRSFWVNKGHSWLCHHIHFYPPWDRLPGFSCWTAGGSITTRDSMILDATTIRAERRLGRVCSDEQYNRVFEQLNTMPSNVEHLIIQLGDAFSSVTFTSNKTECLHRDSDRVSPYGVFGKRVVIKIQSSCHVGAVGIFRHIEGVCEQV